MKLVLLATLVAIIILSGLIIRGITKALNEELRDGTDKDELP